MKKNLACLTVSLFSFLGYSQNTAPEPQVVYQDSFQCRHSSKTQPAHIAHHCCSETGIQDQSTDSGSCQDNCAHLQNSSQGNTEKGGTDIVQECLPCNELTLSDVRSTSYEDYQVNTIKIQMKGNIPWKPYPFGVLNPSIHQYMVMPKNQFGKNHKNAPPVRDLSRGKDTGEGNIVYFGDQISEDRRWKQFKEDDEDEKNVRGGKPIQIFPSIDMIKGGWEIEIPIAEEYVKIDGLHIHHRINFWSYDKWLSGVGTWEDWFNQINEYNKKNSEEMIPIPGSDGHYFKTDKLTAELKIGKTAVSRNLAGIGILSKTKECNCPGCKGNCHSISEHASAIDFVYSYGRVDKEKTKPSPEEDNKIKDSLDKIEKVSGKGSSALEKIAKKSYESRGKKGRSTKLEGTLKGLAEKLGTANFYVEATIMGWEIFEALKESFSSYEPAQPPNLEFGFGFETTMSTNHVVDGVQYKFNPQHYSRGAGYDWNPSTNNHDYSNQFQTKPRQDQWFGDVTKASDLQNYLTGNTTKPTQQPIDIHNAKAAKEISDRFKPSCESERDADVLIRNVIESGEPHIFNQYAISEGANELNVSWTSSDPWVAASFETTIDQYIAMPDAMQCKCQKECEPAKNPPYKPNTPQDKPIPPIIPPDTSKTIEYTKITDQKRIPIVDVESRTPAGNSQSTQPAQVGPGPR